ncbi:hypothetical protein QMZ92_12210 [Streptomyces sp. HNM0645]|uniref:hypothetical protein n=1 Tax=Streptomyces sp. HNM0645 TaxID=2782343 RepID=UPI0024B6C6A7|nr:hypothetical protein [Streptomyces sp. HNM0645]MDI9885138.1 hypothetical protein [Streptomyces sp. HNM0645]
MHPDHAATGLDDELRAALRAADVLEGGPASRAGRQGAEAPPAPDHRRVAHLVPGTDTPSAPRAWKRAWRDVLAGESARTTRSGLGWALTSLAGGRFAALDVLEIGCERLRLSRVAYGGDGRGPAARPLADSAWGDLTAGATDHPCSPALPAERLRRLFLLAGGTGPAAADVTGSLGRALRTFVRGTPLGADPLLVVVRAAGWRPVEQAADVLCPEAAPVLRLRLPAHWPADPGDLTDALPLRRALWLAAADIDGTSGTVGLVRRPLFPAGSRTGDPVGGDPGAVVRVPVAAPPDGATTGASAAVVVSADPGEPPARWRPVRADRIELPPGSRAALHYRLRGPDRVDLAYDGHHEPETAPWAALAHTTPRRLSRPRPVDLVLAVEVAGPQAGGGTAVEERLQEAAAVVAAVRHAVGGGDTLRVGLIGYRDHAPLDRPNDSDPIVHRLGMTTAQNAERALAGWHHSALRHDFATGLEHVPHELAARRHLWRPDSHRVLLVVGSRPPHPRAAPPQVLRRSAAVRICPDRVEWEAALYDARHYDGVSCVAVVDEPAWMDHLEGEPHLARWADRAWDLFGADGRFTAGHDPHRVASAVTAPALCLPEDGAPIRLVVPDGASGEWLHEAAG